MGFVSQDINIEEFLLIHPLNSYILDGTDVLLLQEDVSVTLSSCLAGFLLHPENAVNHFYTQFQKYTI